MKALILFRYLALTLAVLGAANLSTARAHDGDDGDDRPGALTLTGFQEVPSIVSDATATFKARVAPDGSKIDFELTYSGFDSTVIQSHIHIAQRGVNGAVSVFLCGPAAPAHTTCPQSGTVTGTLTAADVLNVPAQGVAAGQLDRLIRAIRAGVTYANIHTANHPGGEIRVQIIRGD